jgi:hypothetical protein
LPSNLEVERAAETHFFVRPVLLKALQQIQVRDFDGATGYLLRATS